MTASTPTQRRANVGGEIGANGEFYEGGKFIATTDHDKRRGSGHKATGRQEIEPYVWDTPPEPGMRSLFRGMGQGVFVLKGKDGQLALSDNDVTWAYYFKTPEAITEARNLYQTYIDRYTAGERWLPPHRADLQPAPQPPDTSDEAASSPRPRFRP